MIAENASSPQPATKPCTARHPGLQFLQLRIRTMAESVSWQMQVGQNLASHHEPPSGQHNKADDDINKLVKTFKGEPMCEPEMCQLARQRLLRREGQREDRAGAQAAPG